MNGSRSAPASLPGFQSSLGVPRNTLGDPATDVMGMTDAGGQKDFGLLTLLS